MSGRDGLGKGEWGGVTTPHILATFTQLARELERAAAVEPDTDKMMEALRLAQELRKLDER